jgi:hypothetical protein
VGHSIRNEALFRSFCRFKRGIFVGQKQDICIWRLQTMRTYDCRRNISRLKCHGKFEVKRLIPLLAFVACQPAFCNEPEKSDAAQAVMYELTYNSQTLVITHAQVIGAYPSVDKCREAMPKVVAMASSQLDSNERMQLQCSGIRSPDGVENPVTEPAVAATTL